ncbi:hypothetical protein WN51_14206 [Melipona quadrifasciata]|uniref:Uncharacterized protein n=1 Tax=Melipona quadrifasciata TaxID=166423 RepID=A0A0M9A0X6_9HYME|nr:hypothetical protein WN51_14206 [Melipona quadrifasciata]
MTECYTKMVTESADSEIVGRKNTLNAKSIYTSSPWITVPKKRENKPKDSQPIEKSGTTKKSPTSTSTLTDHKIACETLKLNKIQYFTYTPKTEKNQTVLLKDLEGDFDIPNDRNLTADESDKYIVTQ